MSASAAAPPPTTPGRQFSEPLRELGVFALLGANGIFLVLGIVDLLIAGEGTDRAGAGTFAQRCVTEFTTFAGPAALALPLLAMVLATHAMPMVRRVRTATLTAMVELAVSGAFSLVAYLGAFGYATATTREAIEGFAQRSVWLTLLGLACLWATRIWLGLFPGRVMWPKARFAATPTGAQAGYGRPYPGQPMLVMPTFLEPNPAAYARGSASPVTSMLNPATASLNAKPGSAASGLAGSGAGDAGSGLQATRELYDLPERVIGSDPTVLLPRGEA